MVAERGPITATQLSRATAMDRSAVRRLLTTLQGRGMVLRVGTGYVLGPSLVRLAERVSPSLRTFALPAMSRLADDVGETVLCHIRQGDVAVVLAQVVGVRHPVRVEEELGRQYPLHLAAAGLALLGAMPAAEASGLVGALSEKVQLEAELRDVRLLGYAVSHGRRRAGVSSIAAVVRDASDQPIFTLSVVVPDQRGDSLPRLLAPLFQAVHFLSATVSGDDDPAVE